MTATRVSYSTMATQSWQNIYDVINTRANVADPIGNDNRKFVYTREPDVKAAGFAGFPYIIVGGTGFVPSRQTVNRKSAQVDFTCEVEIVTCDRGRGSMDQQGFSQLNTITDDVAQTFMDNTIRSALRLKGLLFSSPDVRPNTVEVFDSTLVFRRKIILPFKTRMPVSA